MLTIDIVIISIVLTIYGLLLVFVGQRLRSDHRPVLLHLAVYLGFAFLAYLSSLMAALEMAPPLGASPLLIETLLLFVTFLSFGSLTLSLLKVKREFLTGYWGGTILLVLLWLIFSLAWGSADLETARQNALVTMGIGWFGAIAAVLTSLGHAFKKQNSAQQLNRLRYWLIVTALLAGGSLILFFNPALAYWAGTLLFVTGSGLACYIVLIYHTPDLKRLVGGALRYIGVTAVTATVFYLGLAATIIVSRSSASALNTSLWSMFLAILLAVIAPPLWAFIRRFFNQIIFGKSLTDEKEIVQHYSRSISSALDMQRLGEILIKLMLETLDTGRGGVFINERGNNKQISLRLLAGQGIEQSTRLHFRSDSLFINYFRQGHKFLHQYDIDELPEFSEMDPDERAWLAALNMELYVPISRYQNFMGLLAFGPRADGGAYHKDDINLMIALADQTVLAMDSARLFEQLASINQEVGSLNQKMAGLDQNKSDFLSIASHELRTPLTHIHGYSKMLLDLTDEEIRDTHYVKTIVEGIAKGSERMKNIIDMMFDVTEADGGEMSLMRGPVNLKEIVSQATGPFLAALDERRIAFDRQGFDELPVLQADGVRLIQAFENLMSNAIKYTPDGGLITIEANTTVADDIGPAVEFIVRDSGIGLDPKHHQAVFEKFFRVDDTAHHSTGKTKFKGAGPGLGLTLVKSIATAHGGRVWVESEGYDEVKCPGCQFHLVIPLQPVDSLDLPPPPPKQSQIETVHWGSKAYKPDHFS